MLKLVSERRFRQEGLSISLHDYLDGQLQGAMTMLTGWVPRDLLPAACPDEDMARRLAVLGALELSIGTLLRLEVEDARLAGFSWGQIAITQARSRQAVSKRFRESSLDL